MHNLTKTKKRELSVKSDRGKWFISHDNAAAIKCDCDSFLEMCKKIFGPEDASCKAALFRRATFEEYCSLELELLNNI